MSYKSWAKNQIPNKINNTNSDWDKRNHPIKPGTIVSIIGYQSLSRPYKNGIVVTREEAAKQWGLEISKGQYGKNTVWVNWPNFGILQSPVNVLTKEISNV